jgi:hypothetical protein
MAALPALVFICAGCSGVNATGSVSPASFLLPGLLRADPLPARPDRILPADEPAVEVAQF